MVPNHTKLDNPFPHPESVGLCLSIPQSSLLDAFHTAQKQPRRPKSREEQIRAAQMLKLGIHFSNPYYSCSQPDLVSCPCTEDTCRYALSSAHIHADLLSVQNKETDWSKCSALQSQEQKDDYHDNCVFRQCSSVVRRFPFELFVRARWPKRVLRRAGYLIHMAVYPQFQRWIFAVAPHHICDFRHDLSYEG